MSKMILIDEATVTKALEALEAYKGFIDDAHILEGQWHWIDGADNAQAALREALMSGTDGAQSRSDEEQPRTQSPDVGGTLAQQSAERGEPVATNQQIIEWADRHDFGGTITDLRSAFEDAKTVYTATPQAQPRGEATLAREPLPYDKNDMEGLDANQRLGFKLGWKSAEAAHGINAKGNT